MLGADLADRLTEAAHASEIRGDQHEEQGNEHMARIAYEVAIALHVVAHVIDAVHGDDDLTEGGDE